LVLVCAATLLLAKLYSNDVVALLLPVIAAEAQVLDDNVSIRDLILTRERSGDTVLMRANLVRPLHFKNWTVYPLGWKPRPAGWYQVHLNAHGVLQSSLILLIVVLAWPQRTGKELTFRLLITAPLMVILFALDTPLDMLANFQEAVIRGADPQAIRPLFEWARFLEGGGSAALALAFAAVAISLAANILAASPGIPPKLPPASPV